MQEFWTRWRNTAGRAVAAIIAVVRPGRESTRAAESWVTFRAEDAGFTIELPDAPRIERTMDGDVGAVSLELEVAENYIGVEQTRYPVGHFAQRPADQLLDMGRDAIIEKMGIPLLAERRFRLGSHPAADFEYGAEGFFARSRIVLSGDVVFSLIITRPTPFGDDPAVARIMSSFAIRE